MKYRDQQGSNLSPADVDANFRELVSAIGAAVAGKQDTLVSGTNIKTVNGTSLLGAGDIALEKYRGLYVSLAALNTAAPTASAGDYADVDSGSGSNVKRYIWDTSDTAWVEQTGGVSGMANPMTTAGDLIVGGAAGAPTRLPVGATGKILGVTSGAPAWVDPPAGGGSGLTNLVEAKSIAAPNATVPVVSLSVSITEANGDLAITPKGTGAILRSVPDGTVTGGNKRGNYAVDLQASRTSSSDRVASGVNSAIVGGSDNLASGTYSGVFGGLSNKADNAYSVCLGGGSNTINSQYAACAGGLSNVINGNNAVVTGGVSNTAGGAWSAIIGGGTNSTTSAATYSAVLGGQNNTADSHMSVVLGGQYGITRGISGVEVHASGRFANAGDAQRARHLLRRQTTDATPVTLSSLGSSAASDSTPVLPNTSTFVFSASVVARSGADQKAWSISGLITRGANATATALVGTPVVTVIGASAGASAWAVDAVANTALGALTLSVTGVAATTIKWVADIETVEVVG